MVAPRLSDAKQLGEHQPLANRNILRDVQSVVNCLHTGLRNTWHRRGEVVRPSCQSF